MKIPFFDLKRLHAPLEEELQAAAQRVIHSGHFILGPELEAFETEWAGYIGVPFCIGVGNGLEAIQLLLKAYGIGSGEEVLVPAHTFIATWLAVTYCGATPIPVEPDLTTYNMDPSLVRTAITPRTRALLPVHLYGQPAEMEVLQEIALQHDLILIEDAAQSQGALYRGHQTGSLGDSAATSFYPGKNLGALGDGGAILTRDPRIAQQVRKLRNYGAQVKYTHELAGHNSRLDELQAAFLRVKLRHLDTWNERRRALAELYTAGLQNTPLVLPKAPDWVQPVWHQYVVRTPHREKLRAFLEQKGIATLIHYPTPPHKQQAYASLSLGALPRTESLTQEVLSLPLSPALEEEEVQQVIHAVQEFFDKISSKRSSEI